MTLTLTIENLDRLDNGEPTQLKLDRHGAVIGRSPHSDWSLPDPKNYISSIHCEIDYRDGGYLLIDKSTNGTLVNTGTSRIEGPHKIEDGDVIVIGHYRIKARTQGGAAKAAAPPPAANKAGWGGWDDLPGSAPAPSSTGWDTPAASHAGWGDSAPAASGWGDASAATPAASGWGDAPPAPAPAPQAWGSTPAGPAPAAAGWDSPAPAAPSASGQDGWGSPSLTGASPVWDPLSTGTGQSPDPWESAPASAMSGRGPMAQNWTPPVTSAPPGAPAAAEEDPWARFNASNTVDWARGGFADPEPAPPSPAPKPVTLPQAVAAAAPPDTAPSSDAAWSAFLAASGISPDLIKSHPDEAASAAGSLLKRLVSGLVVMMEARARAKSQLGAQSTTLELNGNNPLKFARSPDKVLAQLLNPPERGFMDAARAVEDSFQDLQAHQMATLAAMQGALRSTLERFSPDAIRARAETRGLMAKILPSARNSALWEAYQREFEGVARGSDEAFLDVFAKAFKAAYEQAAADMKRNAR